MSKFVGTGPSSYKKRIYRAVFSQTLRNTLLVGMHHIIARTKIHANIQSIRKMIVCCYVI